MVIGGLRQVQQVLQQPVDGGCVEEIHAAHHMGDALQRIVNHNGEMIARRRVGTRQHHIAPERGKGLDLPGPAVAALLPEQRDAGGVHRLFHVEPPGVRSAGGEQRIPLRLWPLPVYGRVKRRVIRIAWPEPSLRLKNTNDGLGFPTAEKSRIGEARVDQHVQRRAILIEMFRLPPHRLFPGKSQPAEIIMDRLFQLRRAARLVDILDAQQKAAAIVLRHVMVQEGGKRVAEMQQAVGAWRKTVNRFLTERRRHGFFCHVLKRPTSRLAAYGMTDMKIITGMDDISEGLEHLAHLDPALSLIIEKAGPLELRIHEPGFAGLAHIVVSQMVSRASANAIWARILTGTGGVVTAENYLGAPEELRAGFGLSRAKATTLEGLARAVTERQIDLDGVVRQEAGAAFSELVALRGIGPWTAEVYLMFCGGHPDIFPVGDVALRSAVAHALDLEVRPEAKWLAERAALWSPWRSVAARLFWGYYANIMRRAMVPLP